MNKLYIFIGLIVTGAAIFFGPMAYEYVIKNTQKSISTKTILPPTRSQLLQSSKLMAVPKIDTDKIKTGINDFLDLGTKATGFIIGIVGIASTLNHTHKTRKRKVVSIDKENKKR